MSGAASGRGQLDTIQVMHAFGQSFDRFGMGGHEMDGRATEVDVLVADVPDFLKDGRAQVQGTIGPVRSEATRTVCTPETLFRVAVLNECGINSAI